MIRRRWAGMDKEVFGRGCEGAGWGVMGRGKGVWGVRNIVKEGCQRWGTRWAGSMRRGRGKGKGRKGGVQGNNGGVWGGFKGKKRRYEGWEGSRGWNGKGTEEWGLGGWGAGRQSAIGR